MCDMSHTPWCYKCIAGCCSVVQCVAVCCRVLPCVAVCCSVLQCVAISTLVMKPVIQDDLQSNPVEIASSQNFSKVSSAVCLSRSICCCNSLQLTATQCNTRIITRSHLPTISQKSALQSFRMVLLVGELISENLLLRTRAIIWRSCYHYHDCCDSLQHTATHCNTLQHTATHCNTLQHTATHCNTLY